MDKTALLTACVFILTFVPLITVFIILPSNAAIPPTRAYPTIITENSTLNADSYADFVKFTGIHELHITGDNKHTAFITRGSLSGGETSYFSTTGTTVTINAGSDGTNNMVKVTPATTFINFANFDNGNADGRIRYIGNYTNTFHVASTISIASTSPNDNFVYGIAKNGVVVTSSKVIVKITNTGDTRSTAMHSAITLNHNDYLEVYVGNLDDADDAVVKTMNIFALGM